MRAGDSSVSDARRLAELRFDRAKVTSQFGSVLASVAMEN